MESLAPEKREVVDYWLYLLIWMTGEFRFGITHRREGRMKQYQNGQDGKRIARLMAGCETHTKWWGPFKGYYSAKKPEDCLIHLNWGNPFMLNYDLFRPAFHGDVDLNNLRSYHAENKCGTTAGYKRHRAHGENACVSCLAAERRKRRERMKDPLKRAAENAAARRYRNKPDKRAAHNAVALAYYYTKKAPTPGPGQLQLWD